MTVDVRKSACMNRAAPPVLALCALLLAALWPSAAFPCGGPPATDCAAQLTCVLGSPEIHYLTTSSSAGTDIEVPARLHHSLFPPSSGAPCLNSQLIDVTVEANCEDLLVPGSGADWLFEGENELTDPAQGTQVLDVPLLIDIPAAEREDRGFCALTGTARLVQSDGTEFEVPCGPTSLSFARPNTGETKPILGAHFVDAGAPAEVGSGHYTTVAYTPAMLELLVENHHETECFSGTLQLVTNNENHKPELINGPIGENSNTNLSYTLSSGPGDDFIVQFAPPGDDEEVLLEAMCFDLPEPYLSISPTASREIALDAGESLSVEMWSRTWPNCADGSCSGMAMELSGTFCDGEPYQAFLGGSLIVKSVSFELAAPVGCPGEGANVDVLKCTDDPEDCQLEKFARGEEPTRRAGLIFESELHEPRPAMINTETELSVKTSALQIEEQSLSEDAGRLWETLWLPRFATTPGQELTVTSTFELALAGDSEKYEITEVVVGSKYQPASEDAELDPTSFIGVGRIEVSTSPYMELTTQYQGGVWAVETEGTDLQGLALTAYDMTTADGWITTTMSFLAPDWEIDRLHVSHDLRAYGWSDFEDVCDDLSDNDNDGDVDCDDGDCEGHPACDGDDDDDDSAADDDDSAAGDDDDDDDDAAGDDDDDSSGGEEDGCGCSAASGGLSALGLALLLPGLLALRRRTKVA